MLNSVQNECLFDDKNVKVLLMNTLDQQDIDRIIEMAWEDRTSFEDIYKQFNLKEKEVIRIMRTNLSVDGFKRWRKRVSSRKTKHQKKYGIQSDRIVCPTQKKINR
jgi:TIGR03643 family protein